MCGTGQLTGQSLARVLSDCYYFYQGDYIKCLQYYENPCPSGGRTGLAFTTLYGAYAAKTYQLTGQEERSIPLMESEISRLRRLGLYDELSLNY